MWITLRVIAQAHRLDGDEDHTTQFTPLTGLIPAITAYERVGFKKEGLLRENRKAGDRYWSTWIMSILEHEWRALGMLQEASGA
jgi:hypothetical protein